MYTPRPGLSYHRLGATRFHWKLVDAVCHLLKLPKAWLH